MSERWRRWLSVFLVITLLTSGVIWAEGGASGHNGTGNTGSGGIQFGNPLLQHRITGYRIYLAPSDVLVWEGDKYVTNERLLHDYKEKALYELSTDGSYKESEILLNRMSTGGNPLEVEVVFKDKGDDWINHRAIIVNSGSGVNSRPSFSCLGLNAGSYVPWAWYSTNTQFASFAQFANRAFAGEANESSEYMASVLTKYHDKLVEYYRVTSDIYKKYEESPTVENATNWINETFTNPGGFPLTKEAFIQGGFCLIVEPVILWKRKFGAGAFYQVASFQDIQQFVVGQRNWFPATSAAWRSDSTNATVSKVHMMRNLYTKYESKRGGSLVDLRGTAPSNYPSAGYAIYWHKDEIATATKISQHISLVYDGKLSEGVSGAPVNVSTSLLVGSAAGSYPRLDLDDLEVLNKQYLQLWGGLALGSWGKDLKIPLEGMKGSILKGVHATNEVEATERLTGKKPDWYADKAVDKYQVFTLAMPSKKQLALGDIKASVQGVTASTHTEEVENEEGGFAFGDLVTVKLSRGGQPLNLSELVWGISQDSKLGKMTTVSNEVKPRGYVEVSRLMTNVAMGGLSVSEVTDLKASSRVIKTGTKDTFGLSVAVLVKNTDVTTYHSTIDITSGEVKSATGLTYKYSLNKGYDVPLLGGSKYYVIAYPESQGGNYKLSQDVMGTKLAGVLKGKDLSNASKIRQAFISLGITPEVVQAVGSAGVARVGGHLTPMGAEGYNIINLVVKGEGSGNEVVGPERTDFTVLDYELNYIYPGLSPVGNYYGVNLGNMVRDSSAPNSGWHHSVGHSHHGVAWDVFKEDNSLSIINKSPQYGGTLINYNKGVLKNHPYKNIYYYPVGGEFDIEAKGSKSFSHDTVSGVLLNHAVSVPRNVLGDSLVVSSIHPTTSKLNAKGYLTKNLNLDMGLKGKLKTSGVKQNDSAAWLPGVGRDTFHWEANRKHTHMETRNCTYKVYVEPEGGWVSDGTLDKDGKPNKVWDSEAIPGYYKEVVHSVNVPVATNHVFTNNDNKVVYNITERAKKYVPLDKVKGENTEHTVALTEPVDGYGHDSKDDYITYRLASVKPVKGVTLKFWPEVEYLMFNPKVRDIISDASNVASEKVMIMGEKERQIEPSGLYLMTLRASDGKQVTGQVTSDATATGTRAHNLSMAMQGLPVIYGGGGINLKADSQFNIHTYGYVLDMLDKSDDTNVKSYYGSQYGDIIAGSPNLKLAWGNGLSYIPKKEFKSFIDEIKDKLRVDMTLRVEDASGVKKHEYNDFGASLGKLSGGGIKENPSYNIRLRGGKPIRDVAWQALIKDIAKKYYAVSQPTHEQTRKAVDIFMDSDIYKTMSDAVVDRSDKDNRSNYNGYRWYDEQVRTFVIRAYEGEPMGLDNILVSDKIDIKASPTASTGSAMELFQKGYYGKWYLTLYLTDRLESMDTGVKVYEPELSNSEVAAKDGMLLVNRVHVDGADFIISDATTLDMRR